MRGALPGPNSHAPQHCLEQPLLLPTGSSASSFLDAIGTIHLIKSLIFFLNFLISSSLCYDRAHGQRELPVEGAGASRDSGTEQRSGSRDRSSFHQVLCRHQGTVGPPPHSGPLFYHYY